MTPRITSRSTWYFGSVAVRAAATPARMVSNIALIGLFSRRHSLWWKLSDSDKLRIFRRFDVYEIPKLVWCIADGDGRLAGEDRSHLFVLECLNGGFLQLVDDGSWCPCGCK